MTTKQLSKMLAAIFALALFATACGGGGGGDDQAVIDAVAQAMRDDGDVPEDLDVDCMAGSIVSGLGGAEAMEANFGLTVETIADGQDIDDVELGKDAAVSMADDLMDCGVADMMVAEIAGDGMSAEDAACMVDKLDQDALRDTFASEFMSAAEGDALGEAAEERMFTSMFGAIADCNIDPSSLGF